MIDTKRAMTGTTLTLNKSHELDLAKPFDIVEQLLSSKDLDYTSEDDAEADAEKRGQDELEDDLGGIDTGALEIETGSLEMLLVAPPCAVVVLRIRKTTR